MKRRMKGLLLMHSQQHLGAADYVTPGFSPSAALAAWLLQTSEL